jgi:Holliday junction resolvase
VSRGIQKERDVRKVLEAEGWWTARAAGSFGDADVIAGKAGSNPRLIEVKSTAAGPFHSFGPKDRAELLAAAKKTGFTPELAFWPPRGELRFIPPEEWPSVDR